MDERADTETILWIDGSGDHRSKARLRDDVVLRTSGPWTPSVLALLRHLEEVGFPHAPRLVGTGIADDGREMLTYIPGESPHPGIWSADAIVHIGTILKALHEATESFVPPKAAVWHPSYLRELAGDQPVFGHGDSGPWNWIGSEGRPTALIDWEFAGPVDPLWELAEVVWLNAGLYDDDVAERNHLPDPRTRARMARSILDGYGLAATDRRGFVDRMIEVAVRSARADAVRYGIGPETTTAVSDSGFPFVWGVTWRVRSAAWMVSHRRVLEAAIQ